MKESPVSDANKLEPALIKAAVVVVLGTIMSILDSTIVAVALHTLSGDFHVGVSTIQWVTTGYLLSLAVVIPISGWAVHRIGAKPVYITSLALFVIGSAACGFAWSATSLIVFRVLQGFGGGMIMPVGQSIMARLAGPHRMGRVMGIIGVPQLLGPIMGPVLGGLIVSNTSWRWIFIVNVPIGLVALWLSRSFLEQSPRDREHRFDLPGFLLLSPGLALVVYGLSEVGVVGGFHGHSVWYPIYLGVIMSGLFVWRSFKAAEPLIEMHLFKRRTFTISSIGIMLTGATLYGTMFLLPLYYQIARGDAAWKAGLMLAPQGIGAAIMMRPAGHFSDKHGPRNVAIFGGVLLTLGTLVYTTVTATTSFWLLGVALLVRGFGLGCSMMPVAAASYRGLTHQDVPKATSATNIIRQVGGSLGVAVFAVVLQTGLNQRLGARVAGALQAGLVRPTHTLDELVSSAFAHSLWWSAATCAVAIVPAIFLPNTGVASATPTAPATVAAAE